MLDLLMLGILAVSVLLVYLLIRWCDKQVDSNEQGGVFMIILGAIVLLMGVYLVYALVHPEKF